MKYAHWPLLALAACGSSTPADDPPPSTTSTIAGSVGGKPFGSAATAFWIGKPDFAQSTVLYLFELPIRCSEISNTGWDADHGNANQVLEMKLGLPTAGGEVPSTFTVRPPNPMGSVAPGEADVNHSAFAMKPGTPVETAATGGTVTVTARSAGKSAAGSFHLTFPNSGSLEGSIDAAWCPTGVEP